MRMPFGKHRGWALHASPDDYLQWLLDLELREPLLSAVRDEARRRDAATGRRRRDGGPDVHVAEAIIAAGRQQLARRHHPDKGGTHDAMRVINHTADLLIEYLRGLPCAR